MQEIWKDITGFEGCYQISNFGNVRRLDTKILFKGTLSIRKGREIKTTLNSDKYPTVVLCWKSLRKTHSVHRLVAMGFIPNPENLPQVNHKDGNKQHNHFNNLEWISPGGNQRHAYEMGLKSHSENSGMAKLTDEDVIAIKILLKKERVGSDNSVYKQIGEAFGVTPTTIKWIDKGRTWARITV